MTYQMQSGCKQLVKEFALFIFLNYSLIIELLLDTTFYSTNVNLWDNQIENGSLCLHTFVIL